MVRFFLYEGYSELRIKGEKQMKGIVKGKCDQRFDLVYQEFEKNFEERGEVGASVCITIDGETVVDLWGGVADPQNGRPWDQDTVSMIWSCTKGATALCAHILASRGLIDIEAPVCQYWPEFAANGKQKITVRMLLNHQAGLPAIRKQLPQGAFYDWDFMVKSLQEEEPFWEPGTRTGYHALTFGWLVGEVVKRVSGKSLGTFFKMEVAEPLGLDFWIGLPEEIEPRVALMIPPDPPTNQDLETPLFQAIFNPESIQYHLFSNSGGFLDPQSFNSREARAAEIGAATGVTNARGLAGMYLPLACGGMVNGERLLNETCIAKMSAVSSATGQDATLLVPSRFGLGFIKSIDNREHPLAELGSCIMSEAAFGHPGNGGSLGFADPAVKMSFGYTMNKMGKGVLLNARGQSLVDATYKSLGYKSNKSGYWI